VTCAAREVLEEIGVDFSALVREEDSIVVHRVVDHETGLKVGLALSTTLFCSQNTVQLMTACLVCSMQPIRQPGVNNLCSQNTFS
jgi:hypothetical protein